MSLAMLRFFPASLGGLAGKNTDTHFSYFKIMSIFCVPLRTHDTQEKKNYGNN